MPSPRTVGVVTRAGVAAAIAAAQVGLAYRFALAYRARAGYPRRFPPTLTPADLGLQFERMTVPSEGIDLPAWFIPARDGAPAVPSRAGRCAALAAPLRAPSGLRLLIR